MTLNPPQDFRSVDKTHRAGLAVNRPAAADVLTGTLYFATDTGTISRSDGSAWTAFGGGGSGALTLLEQYTASGSASINFTTGITSAYDDYVFRFMCVTPANAAVNFQFQVSTNGGVSYDATANYHSGVTTGGTAAGTGTVQQSGATFVQIAAVVDNTLAWGGVSGQLNMFNPLSSSIRTNFTQQIYNTKATDALHGHGLAVWNSTTPVNAIKFYFSAGNIATGTIRLYGVQK